MVADSTPLGRAHVEVYADLRKLEQDLSKARTTARRGVTEMERGFDRRLRPSVERLTRATQALNGAVQTASAGMRRMAQAFGIGLSVQALRGVTTAALQSADALATTAARVGFNVEALQELRSAAESVNVSQNTLDTGLQRLTRRLGEARKGTGVLLPILKEYKIELHDANGRLKESEEILYELADATRSAESDGERLRMMVAAFDTEGAGMVNMLRNGSEGLRQMRQRARELGHVMSAEVVAGASQTNTALGDLFRTIRTQFQEGLLDTLTQSTGNLAEIAKDAEFQAGLRAIGQGIGNIGQAIKGSIEQLGNFVRLLQDPSWTNLGALLQGSAIGIAARTAEWAFGGDKGAQRAQQLAELTEQERDARERIAELERSAIPGAGQLLQLERERLAALRQQRMEIMAQLDASAEGLMGPGATLPTIRAAGDTPPGTLPGTLPGTFPDTPAGTPSGTPSEVTIDAGAEAALAAMQRAAEVRDAHADSVGEMLTRLEQEIEANALNLRYLHDQSGELEVQQRLLEIRRDLGEQAAAQAEPFLRQIQEQTNAMERQQNVYNLLESAGTRAFDRIGGAMTRIFMEGQDAALTWSNTINAILSEIMQTMLQLAVINPLKNALFGGNAATLADVGGILGSVHHGGGIVGQPTQTRLVPAFAFANAPRLHRGGIAGDEVPAILRRGEEVLTTADPRHRRNQAEPAQNITINISAPGGDPQQIRRSIGRAASELARAVARGQKQL